MFSLRRHLLAFQLKKFQSLEGALSSFGLERTPTVKEFISESTSKSLQRRGYSSGSILTSFLVGRGSPRSIAKLRVGVGGCCNYCHKAASAEQILPPKKGKDEDVEEATATEQVTSDSDEPEGEDDQDAYDDEEDALFLTDDQMQELSLGDPEIIKRIKYIQLEYSVFREEGGQVPLTLIKMTSWKELLLLDSRSKRRKFFLFLFKNEMKMLSDKRKKELKRQKRLESFVENPLPPREEDVYGMHYNLHRNTLFLRLYDTTINRHFQNRMASAAIHNPPLIIDMSYDEFMSPRECKNCAKQLELVITETKQHREPFNLHLTSTGPESMTMHYLQRLIPTIYDDAFVLNIKEDCFTNYFPKKNLVYLTPHVRDDLEVYDEDDIYIIGAMVDKSSPRPYSFAKAKKLGLRMKRLPLDQHLMWGLGGKSLTLNQMMRIMHDVRYTRGDWKSAMKHVPMRKLCRDFHPYPNQIQRSEDGDEASQSGNAPYRKERRSSVITDFELLNRQKGFRRSNMFGSNQVRAPRMRSILHDD